MQVNGGGYLYPFLLELDVPVKRKSARDVSISEVEGNGERVAILCSVVDFDAGSAEGKVDDGTGVATIMLEDVLFAERLRSGALVRILGRAYKSEDGVLIRVELVQDMAGVDPALYQKVRSIERRVYGENRI